MSNNVILKTSLFKDIITKRPEAAIMLDVQYRMHPQISQFANEEFYEKKIKNGVSAWDRTSPYKMFNRRSVVVVDCKGAEIKVDNSYKNPEEAKLIYNLIRNEFDPKDYRNIGVITGFAPQEELL